MRELVLPLALLPTILPTNAGEAETWWTIAQRNGVGFVFFILFLSLTALSIRRERKVEIARAKREADANAERIALQTQIRDLTQAQLTASEEHGKRQLAQSTSHARKLEGIIEDGNKVQVELSANIKQLARKVNCPVPAQGNNSATCPKDERQS